MTAPGVPLRLLLIEDDDDDATLLLRQLRAAGYAVLHTRVASARQLEEALGGAEWDLVVSDYHLPGYDVRHALALVRQRHPELPFIILSGEIGEVAAVECMRAGANDYLLKSRPAHLPQVIARELKAVADRAAKRDEERRRQAEQRARERAEQDNLFKTRFLTNMSHELRTPLNAVIGFSEVLASEEPGPLNAEQKDFVATVLESGRHLLELINDILDLARIEAGKVTLDRAPTAAAALADKVRAMVRPLAAQRAVEVHWAVEPITIDVDPVRFREILSNLVGNAIKFTPRGGRVDVSLRGEGTTCLLVVTDTGVGIRAADLPRLFREFERIGETGREGSGLGLALTKRLVELHGGEITVESELGLGSQFIVRIPSAPLPK